MKRLLLDETELEFNIIIFIEYPFYEHDLAASTSIFGKDIPTGEVISKLREHSDQAIQDYDDFVANIEDLLIDYYNLELTYFDNNLDNSRYYNFLAKDSSGNIVARFRLRLRISNHDSHRTNMSQKHKKEEEESPELLRLLTDEQRRKLKPYTKSILINNQEYNSYEEAYDKIDNDIENWIEFMTRKH